MKSTFILLGVLAAVVAAGVVYVLRPYQQVDLSGHVNEPTPTSIDRVNIQPINQAVQVTLKTNKGDIQLVLDGASAPLTVGNFVRLALDDFYDGVMFHRVIPGFMIQGGDPTGTGSGGPGYQFQDEINQRKLVRGSLAMANAGPNTNGSQFFIVTALATPHLDGFHTNFGQVVGGMDVVDAISRVERDDSDKPLQPIVIEDVIVHNVTKKVPESPALKIE